MNEHQKLERDIEEAEARIMKILSRYKKDLEQVKDTQVLHSDTLEKMLEPRTMHDAEKLDIRDSLRDSRHCEYCS